MAVSVKKKRASGVPTGNAGEYFVMGELLRKGYDAQLADRNTRGYDLLVRSSPSVGFNTVQVKSVRIPPWYVKPEDFESTTLDQVTIYVVIGKEDSKKPIRYFIAQNRDLKCEVAMPATWGNKGASAFMNLRSVLKFENNWDALGKPSE